MNIGFISKGLGTTMSEQRTPDGYAITNGMAAWEEEIAVGKAIREALLTALDYNDITETIAPATLHVLSTAGKSDKTIAGIDWIYAKVGYKLYEQHPEVAFNWIQHTHPDAQAFFLQQMDVIVVYGSPTDEGLLWDMDSIQQGTPDVKLVFIDAETKKVRLNERA